MIIDCILDRNDSENRGDYTYNAHDFYIDILGYREKHMDAADKITRAMDTGTETDVQRALCDYIVNNGYNLQILTFITTHDWIVDDRPKAKRKTSAYLAGPVTLAEKPAGKYQDDDTPESLKMHYTVLQF